jgi:hypothetical protein
MNEIKHFKLTNGEEIVCDVIEWPDVDGDSPDIVVRNAFKIITSGLSHQDNIRYYQFRPWMIYQDEPEMFQILNGNHILGEANPPESLLEQYLKMIGAEDLKQSDIERKLSEYIDEVKSIIENDSNSASKILQFVPKGRLN